MNTTTKIILILVLLTLGGGTFGYWYYTTADEREASFVAWNEHCAGCHGETLKGTERGVALIDVDLKRGDSLDELMAVISDGVPGTAKTGWEEKLSAREIKLLAIYISEQRQKFPTVPKSYAKEPKENRTIRSKHHDFRLELVTSLESRPYSIAPMPDGNILVAEKIRGLSIVDQDGHQNELISDTPEIWGFTLTLGDIWVNLGTVLDVELHPDYEQNG